MASKAIIVQPGGGYDKVVRLWNPATGAGGLVLKGHGQGRGGPLHPGEGRQALPGLPGQEHGGAGLAPGVCQAARGCPGRVRRAPGLGARVDGRKAGAGGRPP